MHTGEPLVTDEGYVGIDVHRAARIASAEARISGTCVGSDGAAEGVRERAGAHPLEGYTLRFNEEVTAEIRSSPPVGEFETAWERVRQEETEEFLEQALSDLD